MTNDKSRATFGDGKHDLDRADDLPTTLVDEPGTVVLKEERIVAGTEKVRAGVVRVRVKVVTEEHTVTIPLRRQVLEIIEDDVDADGAPQAKGLKKSQEIVLHRERVAIETIPYESVRLSRKKVREDVVVATDVSREVLSVDGVEPRR